MSMINHASRETNCKILHYGKRDMDNTLSPEELRAQINPVGVPDFKGIATTVRAFSRRCPASAGWSLA